MNVVLLFFCLIIGIILASIVLLLISTIRLNIEYIKISNFEDDRRQDKIKKDFLIYIEICLFGKIKIAKIKIRKQLLDKIKKQASNQDMQKEIKMLRRIDIRAIVKTLNIKALKFNLNMKIGIEDTIITAFLVAFLSAILGILLRNGKDIDYRIIPLYQYGNAVNFNLSCIFSVKMVHIIYVIYIFLRKGRIRNERTSNRRAYEYGYE